MAISPTQRKSSYGVHPLFLARWSPRSFDASHLAREDLLKLLEAAHWAPSAFNAQPWRFFYAFRESADWDKFVKLLIPFNQDWARHASALIFVVSKTHVPNKQGELTPFYSHSFDAGAAWAMLSMQATELGLICHAMSGIDLDLANDVLKIDAFSRIEAAIAIGRRGDSAALADHLRDRDFPSTRRDLNELIHEGVPNVTFD